MTPLLRQYFSIKKDYQDSLLLFQVGDFYELFFEDAIIASKCLSIALAKKSEFNGEPIPFCGVPMHAHGAYLAKLIKNGFCVAICNQTEPAVAGKIVARQVVSVLTPSTLIDSHLLDEKSASYLCSISFSEDKCGIVFSEILTSSIFATSISMNNFKNFESELCRFFPDELVSFNEFKNHDYILNCKKLGYFIRHIDKADDFEKWINLSFKNDIIEKVKLNKSVSDAIDVLYSYLNKNNKESLNSFSNINFYEPNDFMNLDFSTQKNLELISNNKDGSRRNTLLDALDDCMTPMGSRIIKKWITRPLLNELEINNRLDVVGFFKSNFTLMQNLKKTFSEISDIERIAGRIVLKKTIFNDYVMLKQSLEKIIILKKYMSNLSLPILLSNHLALIDDFESLILFLKKSLNEDGNEQWIVAKGFDCELDFIRQSIKNSNQYIFDLEKKAQEKTGISSLKIKFSNIFGYSFEVTNANSHLIPDYFLRQQTLSGRERFTTIELKELESLILKSNSEVESIEAKLFENIKIEVFNYTNSLKKLSFSIGNCDALLSFASIAYLRNYVRPEITKNREFILQKASHPVIELKLENRFVKNDLNLSSASSTLIITGPNMGGKSTYLRQTALIAIMAQCGSFVCAQNAKIPIFEKIFTRIGASDNVAEGKSTFLIEMEETSFICNTANERSLILLDEIGRGTSTFDGIAIAQSVTEFLHKNVKAFTLFATHYYELTEIENRIEGISNFYASCKKTEDSIVFLHKIEKGISTSSYAIDVAKLSLMPEKIILRAKELLNELEVFQIKQNCLCDEKSKNLEIQLFDLKQKLNIFDSIDLDNITSKQALDFLFQMKK